MFDPRLSDQDDVLTKIEGRSIMIVEDQALIAMDLIDFVEDIGGEPLGPHLTVKSCMKALSDTPPDLAVLDVRLSDGEIFPVAERLMGLDVPMIFVSGHAEPAEIAARFPDALVFLKPVSHRRLHQAILSILR